MQQNTVGALGWLYYYSRVLHEPLGSCGDTAEQYNSTREAVLVQQVLLEHPVCCVGRARYYSSTHDALLVQPSTIGALGSLGWYSKIL